MNAYEVDQRRNGGREGLDILVMAVRKSSTGLLTGTLYGNNREAA